MLCLSSCPPGLLVRVPGPAPSPSRATDPLACGPLTANIHPPIPDTGGFADARLLFISPPQERRIPHRALDLHASRPRSSPTPLCRPSPPPPPPLQPSPILYSVPPWRRKGLASSLSWAGGLALLTLSCPSLPCSGTGRRRHDGLRGLSGASGRGKIY